MPARLPVSFATALAVLGLLAGCGSGSSSSDSGPRAIVERFGRASASHDYQQICDHLVAPALASRVEQIGLPCELAFKQGLEKVRAPKIVVGEVRVIGATAYVRVHSTAANQPPSDDTLKLVRNGGTWRIAALTSTPPPAAATTPDATHTETDAPPGVPPGAIPTG